MALRLFIFDLAGTLVRDDGIVLGAYRRILADEGLTATDEWIQSRMGRRKARVFAELLRANDRNDADADRLALAFDDAMARSFEDVPPEPLPGAHATLDALDDAGVLVAFNTGFSRRVLNLIVDAAGWSRYPRVSSDDVAEGRPAPDMILEAMKLAGVTDPDHVGVCGDAPADLLAGTNAGCAVVVGIGHGTHALDELRPFPHTHLIDDLTPIPDIATSPPDEP